MSARYSGQTTTTINGVEVPVAQVTIYVYDSSTGLLATLTADGGGALTNPFTSDTQGNFAFNVATAGLYDLVYYVGGKQVLRQNGVPVGTGTNPLTTFVQNIVNTTPLTVNVTSGAAFSYPTRGGITGITSTTIGQRVFLAEAGRQGWWELKSGNYATLIAADVYQGLYLPHASLATSAAAWVRDVANNTYLLDWWNPTQLGNNGHTVLATVAALLPSGATLLWGPNIVTVAGSVSFTLPVHVLGVSSAASRIEVAAGTTAGTLGVQGVLRIRDSHSSVRRMGFKGIETGLFSGNPPCLLVQKAYTVPATLAQRLIEDVEISECEFENTSLGIALAASAETTNNNGVIVQPSKNVRIHHNIITTNQHGIEVFGSDNADIHDNEIWPSPNAAAGQFSCAIRILGSEEVWVHDNKIKGLGQDGSNRTIFRMSAADFAVGARRSNKNVRIRNNDCTNTWTLVWVDECQGDLIFEGNSWVDPISSTVLTVAFHLDTGGVVDGMNAIMERFYSINNRFEGCAFYVSHNGIAGKYGEFVGDTVIGNAGTVAGSGRLLSAPFAGFKYMLFDKVRWILNDNGGFGFLFKNAAGCTLKVVNCVLPEQSSGAAMLDGDGTGTFIKTLGNSGEDATYGANSKHAAGTLALVT